MRLDYAGRSRQIRTPRLLFGWLRFLSWVLDGFGAIVLVVGGLTIAQFVEIDRKLQTLAPTTTGSVLVERFLWSSTIGVWFIFAAVVLFIVAGLVRLAIHACKARQVYSMTPSIQSSIEKPWPEIT